MKLIKIEGVIEMPDNLDAVDEKREETTQSVESDKAESHESHDWAEYYQNRTLDEIMEDNYDGEWT